MTIPAEPPGRRSKGRPHSILVRMTIRSLFLLVVFVFTALLGGLVFVSFLAAQDQQAWALSEERRFGSYKLADELRQSSDDLTRFPCTYVVTGDEKYERFFRNVLAIREGAPRYSTIPIIAMTANAMKGDREMCLDAGMNGYVSKPVKQETLFAEIERVLAEPG